MGFGVGVQLVEVSYAHGQIGVAEQFYRFGFGAVGKQYRYVLFYRTLLQQVGEGFGTLAARLAMTVCGFVLLRLFYLMLSHSLAFYSVQFSLLSLPRLA